MTKAVETGARVYLVAYEGADGKPYAVAVSTIEAADRLAKHFAGELIETYVDVHVDLAD